MNFDHVHISQVKAGDTVMHNDKLMTVCASDLTRIPGMGLALFGSTYNLGHKLVARASWPDPTRRDGRQESFL